MHCKTEERGFYLHPTNSRYRGSPDILVPLGILLEVKTRGEGSSGSLESFGKFTYYFAQCQLQMLCTGAELCILQSYHSESKTFRNFSLLNIIIK